MFMVDKNTFPYHNKECFPEKRCNFSKYTMRNENMIMTVHEMNRDFKPFFLNKKK